MILLEARGNFITWGEGKLSESRESACGVAAMGSSSKGWHPRLSLGGEIPAELIASVQACADLQLVLLPLDWRIKGQNFSKQWPLFYQVLY